MSSVRYLVDEEGRKEGVLLDIAMYKQFLGELEELESIRAYDEAKASGDEVIPFEKAVEEIVYYKRGIHLYHHKTIVQTGI
jgi:hypothetical protein